MFRAAFSSAVCENFRSNNHIVDADVSLLEDDQGRVEPCRNRVSTDDIEHVRSTFEDVK